MLQYVPAGSFSAGSRSKVVLLSISLLYRLSSDLYLKLALSETAEIDAQLMWIHRNLTTKRAGAHTCIN